MSLYTKAYFGVFILWNLDFDGYSLRSVVMRLHCWNHLFGTSTFNFLEFYINEHAI